MPRTTMQKDFSSCSSDRLNRPANQTDPSPWTVAQKMNQRAKKPRPVDARRAGFRLVLSLLPAVAISAPTSLAPEYFPVAQSRPYLAIVGAPGFRFGSPPPPDSRPVASAPPKPAAEQPEAAPAPTVESTATTAMPPAMAEPSVAPTPVESTPKPVQEKTPPPIIPDHNRSRVRAEDFLPYFQFPSAGGPNGDVTVVAPVAPSAPTAPAIPPSSATYRQQ